MNKKGFVKMLAPALTLGMLLTACTSGASNNASTAKDKNVKKEITMLESVEISSMDSVMSQDVVSSNMLENTLEGLYRFDQKNKPVPALAIGKPEISSDGLTYTYKLRDAKWSNGDPVTADNFVSAWRRAIDPNSASPYGPYMMAGTILNADKIVAKKMKPEELGIKALDAKTLEIKLARPIPYFDSLMAFTTFYPEPTNLVKSAGEKYSTNSEFLASNGPFKLEGWDGPEDVEWKLVKNDSYWDAKSVKLKTANFVVSKDPQASLNMFQAGQADITPRLATQGVIAQIQNDPQLKRYLEPAVYWLKFNQKNPALANINIRRAIAMGFDKDALAKDVLNNGSIPANFLMPKDFVFGPDGKDFRESNGEFNKYDATKAKEYWEKGLKEIGKKAINLNYISQDSQTAKLEDVFIKNQLEKNLPGLKLNVRNIPFPQKLQAENKQEYDLLFAGWGPDYQDPMTYSDMFITDGDNNHMSYSNKKYDQLINDAQIKFANDPQKRWDALLQSEKVLLGDDVAVAPIYQSASNRMISDRVKGFVYHLVGPQYCLKWTEVLGK